MKWNWQQPDWPNLRWSSDALAALEARFLQQSGIMIGVVKAPRRRGPHECRTRRDDRRGDEDLAD
jgi:hypothetical protein